MRVSKWTYANQTSTMIEYASHAMDFRRLQSFFERERRQNCWNALGQHGLSGARRADHQNVMTAGTGDFEGAFSRLLSANILKINRKMLGFVQQGFLIDRNRRNSIAGVHEVNNIEQGLHRINRYAAHHGSFPSVQFWHNHA